MRTAHSFFTTETRGAENGSEDFLACEFLCVLVTLCLCDSVVKQLGER
jgi:hypothetical protein